MKKYIPYRQSGQALLTLLLFTIISVTIATAAIIVLFVNGKSTNSLVQAHASKTIAESGAENALLRLMRNPSYTGETLQINGGIDTVIATVSGTLYTITSTATLQSYQSTVIVTASTSAGMLRVASWKEQ